ncbi:acid-resistance protein [Providencia rettgeri DSM 1131]|uniref:HdeA/HdeB family chaperone n=1 Tax=Providencia rettgeri TaxID=587 RepID=UPI000197C70E|nr:HdeA/HdeB family chaperone [Providencia rettgeri]EFE51742.1 acid-resistance protein [Providencia rettgeri DSM 1131]QXA58863.1 ABC transporter substrate-binding protein [Providencia rettgeri]
MKKIFIPICITVATSLSFNVLATENEGMHLTPEKMSCQEYIDLNPQSWAPIAMWMSNQTTQFKGGDFVSLSQQSIAEVPLIVNFCKLHPNKSLKDYVSSKK